MFLKQKRKKKKILKISNNNNNIFIEFRTNLLTLPVARRVWGTKIPERVSSCSFSWNERVFQAQSLPELELSGPHTQKWETHLSKIPVLPLFTLRETIPICYHRSCKFPEREMSEIAHPVDRSTVFPILDQKLSFIPSNKDRCIPNTSKGFYVTYPLI